jgi:hypothetical protein
MRNAYSGRAAAYEKKGDYAKALPDHNLAVLYYALEAEILNSLETPDRASFLADTAQAYRARSKCLEALGRAQAAQVDRKRADALATDAKQLASKAATAARIGLVNAWTQPVTVVIGGVSYRLDVGERQEVPASASSVAYAIQAGPLQRTGTLEAGKTYTIRTPSR